MSRIGGRLGNSTTSGRIATTTGGGRVLSAPVGDGGLVASLWDAVNDELSYAGPDAGQTDAIDGTFSLFFTVEGKNGYFKSIYIAKNSGGRHKIEIDNTGKLKFTLTNAAGTTIDLFLSTTSYLEDTGVWHHCLASWKSGTHHLYMDGVDVLNTVTGPSSTSKDWTTTEQYFWYNGSNNWMSSCISDFYFNSDEYIDLSVLANREKFVLGGIPVDLGATGAGPTGTQPWIYTKDGDLSGSANLGYGATYTLAGALTSCTPPVG